MNMRVCMLPISTSCVFFSHHNKISTQTLETFLGARAPRDPPGYVPDNISQRLHGRRQNYILLGHYSVYNVWRNRTLNWILSVSALILWQCHHLIIRYRMCFSLCGIRYLSNNDITYRLLTHHVEYILTSSDCIMSYSIFGGYGVPYTSCLKSRRLWEWTLLKAVNYLTSVGKYASKACDVSSSVSVHQMRSEISFNVYFPYMAFCLINLVRRSISHRNRLLICFSDTYLFSNISKLHFLLRRIRVYGENKWTTAIHLTTTASWTSELAADRS